MRWFRATRVGALVLLIASLIVPAVERPLLAQAQAQETKPVTVTRGGRTFQSATFEQEPAPDGRPMRAGSLIVKFRGSAADVERDEAHRRAGARAVENLLGTETVRVQVPRGVVALALTAYRAIPAVERAEPDYVVRPVLTPNDPRFGEQWGMTRINAPQAWDISTSSSAARIAVLDCGIYNEGASSYLAPDGQPGHPDLRGKVAEHKNFTTAPDADDYCNHGTHVAGIAAANTNNSIGVAGVGYRAVLKNYKVLDDTGSGSFSWIIQAINWAAGCNVDGTSCGARRADIINLSLGATGPCSASVQAAINTAWTKGLVIFAAAGNAGAGTPITPANCDKVGSVSASDQNDNKASFSNSGADIAAPGVSILSSDYVGGYSVFDGTSMASPHAAGLAALVWTTPHNTSNQAVVDRIFCTALETKPAGSANGRIDAGAAVSAAGCAAPPPPSGPSISINDPSASERHRGTRNLSFRISLSASSSQTVTVSYATANGTASGGTSCGSAIDYLTRTGTATIPAGSTSATVNVSICGDRLSEPNETLVVNLSNPTGGATIADNQGTGTILNDD